MSGPIKFEFEDANFNFGSLHQKNRRYLQAVVSYEYARESSIIRKRLKLWLNPRAKPDDLWDAIGEKKIIAWKTVQKRGLIERGRYFHIYREPNGRTMIQTLARVATGKFLAVKKWCSRPAEEKAFLKARLRDITDMGGEGSVHLTDLARELVSDIPWTKIDPQAVNLALEKARQTAWSVRADHLRTVISDYGLQLAEPSDLKRGTTTRWQRPLIQPDGREIIALRVSWDQFDDKTLIERFARLLELGRPERFRHSNAREGKRADTQLKYLDELAIMRARSVWLWEKVIKFRKDAGLNKCIEIASI